MVSICYSRYYEKDFCVIFEGTAYISRHMFQLVQAQQQLEFLEIKSLTWFFLGFQEFVRIFIKKLLLPTQVSVDLKFTVCGF